ncbi:MAG: N-acetyltransferase [Spirochaetales bacterium]|nr:N-acetyltransferase [Spirochaetales bacterium]
MNHDAIEIRHDRDDCLFIFTDGELHAELNYEFKGKDAINIYRTFVDPGLRGKGIAKALMDRAIEFAGKEKLKVFPTCSYAVGFFRKYTEKQHLLASDVDLDDGGSCRIR